MRRCQYEKTTDAPTSKLDKVVLLTSQRYVASAACIRAIHVVLHAFVSGHKAGSPIIVSSEHDSLLHVV